MVTKEQLVELVEQGQVEMLQYAAALTEDERALSGTPEVWAARDLLAHMAFWKQNIARRIAAARAGRDQVPSKHYQQINEAAFEQYREADWTRIESLLLDSHQELIEQVNALSEEELNIPDHFPTLEKGPLWRNIVGNGFSHPIMHLGTAYIERGEQAYANALRAREDMLVRAMDSSPDWQAESRYNLACHWALSGEPQKALDLLEFSLRHRPDLIDWAQKDTDLISLHGTPEFQSLLDRARKEQENP
jgi:hypothetical protein